MTFDNFSSRDPENSRSTKTFTQTVQNRVWAGVGHERADAMGKDYYKILETTKDVSVPARLARAVWAPPLPACVRSRADGSDHPQASETDIKKAYKKAAMKWHPDKNPDRQAHILESQYAVNVSSKYAGALIFENLQFPARSARRRRPRGASRKSQRPMTCSPTPRKGRSTTSLARRA